MACISTPTAILAGGALSGGSSLLGGLNSSSAATQAAKIQANAATAAANETGRQFNVTQQNLQPWITAGHEGISTLESLLGIGAGAGNVLTAPLTSWINTQSPAQTTFNPSMNQLAQTPGYQFTQRQGQMAVGNQLAASGLAGSGAAGKAQTNYAEGLASTTFQQQYQNWLSQQQFGLQNWLSESNLNLAQKQQIYNMLGGVSSSGQNAATNVGNIGMQTTAQQGNFLTSGAAATAGGIVGSANALNAGFTGVGSAGSNTAMLLALNNAGMFGPAATGSGGA